MQISTEQEEQGHVKRVNKQSHIRINGVQVCEYRQEQCYAPGRVEEGHASGSCLRLYVQGWKAVWGGLNQESIPSKICGSRA